MNQWDGKEFKQKYVDILSLGGFNAFFGDENNKNEVMTIINELLPNHRQVVDIKYMPTEYPGPMIGYNKDFRYDFMCKDASGAVFIVELQKYYEKSWFKRCVSYACRAYDRQNKKGEDYDAVLILRGGGAKLDLACFDDYGLAAVVAQYPIPVLTAIGHDQDYHVCDMVAYEYLKTPTALADFILGMYEDEDARLSSFVTRMKMAFNSRLAVMENQIGNLQNRVRNGALMKLSLCESSLELLRTRIESADPRRILERGYALAVDADGVVMKGVDGRAEGDKVSVVFADGTLECAVVDVIPSEVSRGN